MKITSKLFIFSSVSILVVALAILIPFALAGVKDPTALISPKKGIKKKEMMPGHFLVGDYLVRFDEKKYRHAQNKLVMEKQDMNLIEEIGPKRPNSVWVSGGYFYLNSKEARKDPCQALKKFSKTWDKEKNLKTEQKIINGNNFCVVSQDGVLKEFHLLRPGKVSKRLTNVLSISLARDEMQGKNKLLLESFVKNLKF